MFARLPARANPARMSGRHRLSQSAAGRGTPFRDGCTRLTPKVCSKDAGGAYGERAAAWQNARRLMHTSVRAARMRAHGPACLLL
jgi:hypothetical protein